MGAHGYQKKDGRGHAGPSFFWYDNDKDLNVCFLVMRVNVSSIDSIALHQGKLGLGSDWGCMGKLWKLNSL